MLTFVCLKKMQQKEYTYDVQMVRTKWAAKTTFVIGILFTLRNWLLPQKKGTKFEELSYVGHVLFQMKLPSHKYLCTSSQLQILYTRIYHINHYFSDVMVSFGKTIMTAIIHIVDVCHNSVLTEFPIILRVEFLSPFLWISKGQFKWKGKMKYLKFF